MEEVTCIREKYPSDAATCITNSITPIAFPTFPNIETNEYTIAVNTILVNIDNNTNDKGSITLTFRIYKSPALTIKVVL